MTTDRPPDQEGPAQPGEPFDFVLHRQLAVDEYQSMRDMYEDFAATVQSILKARLEADEIKVNSVEFRAKSVESFGVKAQRPSEDDPSRPKYEDPLAEITDLAGVRIITQFLRTQAGVDRVLAAEFEVVEKTDRSALLHQEERLGYQSVHYLVRLKSSRHELPEYARFANLTAEVQVRTVLQHAWAEIEHDIQYKAQTALPAEIRRRFMTLAGLLEIADREFQGIQDDSDRLQSAARESLAAGRLDEVEITPEALKSYVDGRFGPDGRMREFSYQFEARILRLLGFTNLQQLDEAVSPYDDDEVSRTIHGGRQGQLTRLEGVLVAAMGEEFGRRHPWGKRDGDWFLAMIESWINRLTEAGIPVGTYVPDPPDDLVGS